MAACLRSEPLETDLVEGCVETAAWFQKYKTIRSVLGTGEAFPDSEVFGAEPFSCSGTQKCTSIQARYLTPAWELNSEAGHARCSPRGNTCLLHKWH